MEITKPSETITGYTFQISAKQNLCVVVSKGEFPNCTVTVKTVGGRNLPFGKVFHGADCLLQALDSYKRAAVKKGIRQVISDIS